MASQSSWRGIFVAAVIGGLGGAVVSAPILFPGHVASRLYHSNASGVGNAVAVEPRPYHRPVNDGMPFSATCLNSELPVGGRCQAETITNVSVPSTGGIISTEEIIRALMPRPQSK
jgi:hypothetical protein